ncbi:hypothetical protein BVY91_001007 [Salmonella enterica subsp. enterica serovar Poano]|nr:hypothetical protein [Salmonella enterica]EDT9926949.1 hypothetical protein [Salmonella enterica subsp. enterica serovar Poano]EDW0487501.1 hypothetical protein [Salmonella enterica subsp. enterica serovar Poano]EEJ5267948.1 hypothetical protein [Salmonella enterica subsp. enterica serovar Poano]
MASIIYSGIFLSPKVLFLLQTAPEKSEIVLIYPMKPGHLSLRRYPLFNSCPIITSPR